MSDFKPRRPQRQLKVVPTPARAAPMPVQTAPAVPVEAEPRLAAPEIIEPGAPVAELPVAELPVAEPPVAEPPAAEPPVAEPPAAVSYIVAPEPPPPDTLPAPVTAPPSQDGWMRLVEMQETFARGMGEIAAEITGMARSGTEATADAAVAMLGAKTFAAVFDIQADLTRRNLAAATDALIRQYRIISLAFNTAMPYILPRDGDRI